MRNDLDQDLRASLQEPVPSASPLDQAHLLQHRSAVLREENDLSRMEPDALRRLRILYRVLSVLVACGIVGTLLWGVADLPAFGGGANPTENEVMDRYLSEGMREGGATNLVANMILDYRAFDTLGESHVLFTAACAVLLLLSREPERGDLSRSVPEADAPADPVLVFTARVLCPALLLFGLYVVLNGHLGPGGGFSGGTVMGAALILYRCAFGRRRASAFLSLRGCRTLTGGALAFYALSKAWSFFTGANHLPSGIGPGTPGAILSAGLILPLNIAVGCVVCCTMYGFFALFEESGILPEGDGPSGRSRPEPGSSRFRKGGAEA